MSYPFIDCVFCFRNVLRPLKMVFRPNKSMERGGKPEGAPKAEELLAIDR